MLDAKRGNLSGARQGAIAHSEQGGGVACFNFGNQAGHKGNVPDRRPKRENGALELFSSQQAAVRQRQRLRRERGDQPPITTLHVGKVGITLGIGGAGVEHMRAQRWELRLGGRRQVIDLVFRQRIGRIEHNAAHRRQVWVVVHQSHEQARPVRDAVQIISRIPQCRHQVDQVRRTRGRANLAGREALCGGILFAESPIDFGIGRRTPHLRLQRSGHRRRLIGIWVAARKSGLAAADPALVIDDDVVAATERGVADCQFQGGVPAGDADPRPTGHVENGIWLRLIARRLEDDES